MNKIKRFSILSASLLIPATIAVACGTKEDKKDTNGSVTKGGSVSSTDSGGAKSSSDQDGTRSSNDPGSSSSSGGSGGQSVGVQKPVKPISKAEFATIVNSLKPDDQFELVATNTLVPTTKENTLPTKVFDNLQNWSIKVKDNYINKFKAVLTNATLDGNNRAKANQEGKLTIYVEFTNPTNKKDTIVKSYDISGFKQGMEETIHIPAPSNDEFKTYFNKDLKQRYDYDNQKYTDSFVKYASADGSWESLRGGLFKKTSASEIASFNQKAASVGVSDYRSSVVKGFSTPVYKSDGSVDGLYINQESQPAQPSWVDSYGKKEPFKTTGLARTLPNQTYVDIAKQTYAINIGNFLVSGDENIRNQVAKILENKEDLTEFIKKLSDPQRVKYYTERLTKNPGSQWKEYVRDEVYNELVKENNNDYTKVNKLVNDYLEIYKAPMRKQLEAANFPADVKQRVLNEINSSVAYNSLITLPIFAKQQDNIGGTMWIMDYQIPDDGSYPTKFYFGTNLHVADAIKEGRFVGFGITRMNKDVNPVLNTLKLVGLNSPAMFRTFGFNKEAIRRVFDARDFLKTKPSDYLAEPQKDLYKNVEEFADFAVVEIDFEKVDLSKVLINTNEASNAAALAKLVTNDYKDLPDDKKVKFLPNSYLKDYQKINVPLAVKKNEENSLNKYDQLFILGFPLADSGSWRDFYLKRYIDDDQINVAKYYRTLWINSDPDFYDYKVGENDSDQKTQERLARGNRLSYDLAYRTFIDKPGLTDAFLSAPVLSHGKSPLQNLYTSDDNKQYINFGLEYMPRWYAPGGGASGSSVRNQKNELVGIYHYSNPTARTGLAAAFRSEGYSYNGLYGSYNLPQYDLIYGGGKDQKNSYREAMSKLNIGKTNLFPNGFASENIPEQFKFTNNLLTYQNTKENNEQN
ncbi:Ig-specific serine endopeptidase MIP [Mycoplasma sp. 394]